MGEKNGAYSVLVGNLREGMTCRTQAQMGG